MEFHTLYCFDMENETFFDEDSWENAEIECFECTEIDEVKRKRFYKEKCRILKNFVKMSRVCLSTCKYGVIEDKKLYSVFDRYELIQSKTFETYGEFSFLHKGSKRNEKSDEIKKYAQFISLNKHGIPCRIYFVFNDALDTFLEYKLVKIIPNTEKHDNFVISLDFDGNFKDQSHFYTKKATNYKFYATLLEILVCTWSNMVNCKNEIDVWTKHDNIRYEATPKTLEQVKMHPKLICEKHLKKGTTIFPKRSVYCVLNKANIYKTENLYELRTKDEWYKRGYVPKQKTIKPYRRDKNNSYYLKPQLTERDDHNFDGSVPVLNGNNVSFTIDISYKQCLTYMFKKSYAKSNFLENNFPPCLKTELCKIVGFLDTKIMFIETEPIRGKVYVKGVIVKMNNKDVLVDIVNECEYSINTHVCIREFTDMFRNWKKLIKKGFIFVDFKRK